jgi:hypothetical protein
MADDVELTVKLTKDSSGNLARYAKAAGMTKGEMVAWLVRETSTPSKRQITRRTREPRSEEVSLNLTTADAEALKKKCRAIESTVAQVVEAYVDQAST